MKIIIGLGNPEKKYQNTRHNVGFDVLDRYLGSISWQLNNDALVYETKIDNIKTIFIKPQLYMNLSGVVVKKFLKYYKINYSDMLIIHDDIDLEVGKYKIKTNSTSGGHNGINSIIDEINTIDFKRLKIGISKVDKVDIINHVLGKFSKKEQEIIVNMQPIFNEIIEKFINSK